MTAFALFFCGSVAIADPVEGNEFWASNRITHAGASVAITSIGYGFLRAKGFERWEALLTSMSISLMAGFAKEMVDPEIDTADLRADAIGTAAGGALVLTVDLIAF